MKCADEYEAAKQFNYTSYLSITPCHALFQQKGLGISPQAPLEQKTESLLGVRERRVVGVLNFLGHGLVGRVGGVRMGNQRGGESEGKNQCERFHEANS
jgi:hypothetical protein